MQYQQGYRPPAPRPTAPSGPSPRKGGRRTKRALRLVLLFVLIAAAAAAGITMLINANEARKAHQALEAEVTAVQNVFLPNIYVDGIHLGGMTAQEGINAVVQHISTRQNSWKLQLTYQGHSFITLDYAILGVQTDISQVYALLEDLYQKGKVGTLDARKQEMDRIAAEPIQAFTTQSDISDTQLNSILAQIKDQLTFAPTDASVAYFLPDLDDPFVIQESGYGSSLDVDRLKEQILEMAAAGQGGALEIQPDRIAPAVTTEDVRSKVALLCRATTPISSSSTEDRTSNIRTAFAYINGTTLEPGKQFSFNNITKTRTLKNGYRYAIEYQTGMEVMGVGGGVCQASTTVYLAALKSGMEIIKRTSHSDRVSYTTFGQDATVSDGKNLDLVFRNSSSGTIYITAHVREVKKNSYETEVCIYGPTLGPGVSYQLRTETVDTIIAPLDVSYVKDTDHTYVTYVDEEPYEVRKARDGFVNETYLQRVEYGQVVSEKFISRDTCKEREAVYYVGTLQREF